MKELQCDKECEFGGEVKLSSDIFDEAEYLPFQGANGLIKSAEKCLMSYKATVCAETSANEELMAAEALIKLLKKEKNSMGGDASDARAEEYLRRQTLRRDKLRAVLMCCMARRRAVERALLSLSEEERTVVDIFFLSPKKKNRHRLDVAMEKLDYEKTQIYRLRSAALRKIGEHMFGGVL